MPTYAVAGTQRVSFPLTPTFTFQGRPGETHRLPFALPLDQPGLEDVTLVDEEDPPITGGVVWSGTVSDAEPLTLPWTPGCLAVSIANPGPLDAQVVLGVGPPILIPAGFGHTHTTTWATFGGTITVLDGGVVAVTITEALS